MGCRASRRERVPSNTLPKDVACYLEHDEANDSGLEQNRSSLTAAHAFSTEGGKLRCVQPKTMGSSGSCPELEKPRLLDWPITVDMCHLTIENDRT